MPQRVPEYFTSTTFYYDISNDINRYTHNERQVTSKRQFRTDINTKNDFSS